MEELANFHLILQGFVFFVPRFGALESELVDLELHCRQKHGHEQFEVHFDFPNVNISAINYENVTFSNSDMISFASETRSLKARCLDLSRNRLIIWPQLGSPASLQYLNLSGNLLSQWNIVTYANLKILDLSFNHLRNVDVTALHRLPRLEVLFLQGNQLKIFSDLRQSVSLRSLILAPADWYVMNNIDFGPHPIQGPSSKI